MRDIIDMLYEYFVGPPDPARWPEEYGVSSVAAHGHYAFRTGLCLGLSIVAECFADDFSWR